jgi:DNA-binding SARP family transcriptional activator/tetratricopeptide (TPR) repeat protein
VGGHVIYRLLGELEIGDEGQPVGLPGGPTLNMLAALLVHVNRRMSKTALIRVAWGKDEVQEAQLHKRVNAVRDLLAKIGRRDDLKNHPRYGYELRAADDDVDMLMFYRLLRQADDVRQAGADQEPDAEQRLLRQALGLWRGVPPLSNVPSEAFYQKIQDLLRRRKHAATRLFELELAHGRHEHIMGELSSIADMYPSDRRLSEQLMVAAYRCGHLSDVAEAYERYRGALAEETAGPPDPLLRAFHFAIALGDEAAIAKAESDIARRGEAAGSPMIVPRQLPRAPDLVGRRPLVTRASGLLGPVPARSVPVVVISGPGGIGKTALALTIAHGCSSRFPDGQLYADLRGTVGTPADSAEVIAQFLRALGVPRVPEAKQERLAMYRSLLAERRVLVVLDDAADEGQVSDLVPAEPGCAVLVTARHRLPGTDSYHVPTLEPLDRRDSTELFVRVVNAAGVDLDDDPAAVERVVQLCGGLPLAVRIAGALRARDHPRTTADLAARLGRQGPEGFTYGELSVARTIEVGFDLLGARERMLFLGLGLLPLPRIGQWTAAALLGGDAGDAAEALSRLAESFIIEPAGPGVRYRFHDLTHDYARRRALAEYPDSHDEVRARAYRALLTLARRAHARLYGGDFEVVHSSVPDWDAPAEAIEEVDAAPLDWFEKERDNIKVAVGEMARLGMAEACWDLVFSVHEFYTVLAYFDDWHATASAALRACQDDGNRYGEAVMLVCLSQPALVASRRGGSWGIAGLQRAVDLLAEFEDKHGLAIAQRTLASALRRQGHLTRPLALYYDALRNYEASGDKVGRWQCLRLIGQAYLYLGEHESARRLFQDAEEAATGLRDGRLLAQTRYWIGQASLAVSELDTARLAFGFVLGVYQEAVGPGRAYGLHGLGEVACRTGAYETAEQQLSEAAGLAREGADAILEGRIWMSTAELRWAQGQPDGRVGALREARAVFAGCDAVYLEAWALSELARALREQGDDVGADAACERLESLYRQADVPPEDRFYRCEKQ